MKWVKRLLILLASLLLTSVLILVCAVLLLQESNYKRILGWGAEQFLDSQLIIKGPLKLDIARNLVLSSGEILLYANDDSYRLAIGKLHASFRLGSYLQTGFFWLNNLELQDINLRVKETPEGYHFSFEDFQIPPVVIGQAKFSNIQFAYQELPPGTLHTFSLDDLELKELGEQQPVSLHATGLFEGKPFKLEGAFDSVAQVLQQQIPISAKIALSSENLNIKVQGTIAEPLEGRGLDLKVQADIQQLKDFVEIIWDEIPILGYVQSSFIMRGNYTAPRLEEIDLRMQREQEVDIKVSGSVTDLRKGRGLDLQIEGNSSNPEVLSWLLFKKHDRMQSLQVSGKLQGNVKKLSLQNLDAIAETIDGVKLQANGNVELHPKGYILTNKDAGLSVRINAPSISSVNLLNPDKIPELGPISGSMRLALSQDALGIYHLDFDIGSSKQNQILLKGDIGHLTLGQELLLPELNLQTDIRVAQLSSLGKQFGVELPKLGPARLRGLLLTHGPKIQFQNARLNIGTKGQLTINAAGLLAAKLRDPSVENFTVALDVDVQATEFAQLGQQFNLKLPTVGPVRLRGKLVNKGSELLLQGTKLFIGTDEHTLLHATGMLATHLRDPAKYKVAMDVEFQSNEITRLAETFGYSVPQLGTTRIAGWLESKESELHFKDVTILVGTEKQPDIRANGSAVTQLKKDATNISINYEVAVSPLIAAFSDLQPNNLGRLQGNAVIADLDGDWGIENFNLVSKQTDLYQLQFSGTYDDLETYDKGQMSSSLVINNPHKLGETLGLNLAGLGAFQQKGELTVEKGRLHYNGKMSLGRTNSVTKISGHLKQGKPTFKGSFTIPALYLADFGVGTDAATVAPVASEKKPESPYIFSRDEFDVSFLKRFDLDFAISIDEIESGALAVENIRGKIELNDGHLAGAHQLVHKAGNVDFNLEIKALAKPEYYLSVVADDLMLGTLMAHVTEEILIEGYSNTNFILQTHGNTPHEMASNLSGDFDFALENARIPVKYINTLFVDVFDWVLSSTGARASHANLNCVMMTFGINKGEVRSETVIADAQNMTVTGQIDMDLRKETLNIVLLPKQKKRVFSSSTPVKIQGPMRDPTISAIPATAAAAEIGTMTLFSSVYIPMRLGEKLWQIVSDGDQHGGGCTNIDSVSRAPSPQPP